MDRSATRRLRLIVAALAVVLAVPASAGAVLSGRDGRIVFISGREGPNGDDSQARPYFWKVPQDALSPSVSPAIDTTAGQHRHPTWSPDRTKIAYARGTADSNPATQNFDIYIKDLETGSVQPLTNTGDSLSADRPAWSPDGTRIAYEHQPADASADRIIRVQPVGSTSTVDLTASGGTVETKPAWSPDSQTLFYGVGDVNTPPNGNTNDAKIFREPADNSGTATEVAHISGAHVFQPSISPDGTRICYTQTAVAGLNNNAAVFVAPVDDASNATVLAASGTGDYNCTWSPNGSRIAYVQGVFTTGALVAKDAGDNQTDPAEPLTDDPGNFDGNPDWAPDAAPTCEDRTATTFTGTAVSIPLPCTDNGPQYERTPVNRSIVTPPANGTVNQPAIGETSVTYTPNPGFTGTDTFTYRSRDDFGFAPTVNTVTVSVVEPPVVVIPRSCLGREATIVGTEAADTLTGTAGADVIVSLGGDDTVRSGGGSDLVCTSDGGDRVLTGGGNDRVRAGSGNDRVRAGGGNDRVRGEAGNDRVLGEGGRDRLFGGSGRDRLFGGPAADRLFGQSGRDVLRGGPGRDSVRQ